MFKTFVSVWGLKLDWRLSHEVPTEDCSEEESDAAYREYVTCKVFLGFTSNLVSSGVRDTICYLVQHRMASDIQGTLPVDVVVTIAGGIEEDLIKCLAPTYKGDFSLPGASLRSKGLNCIGNLLVPNDNYCKFENWIIPIFDQMYEEHIKEFEKQSLNLKNLLTLELLFVAVSYKNDLPATIFNITNSTLSNETNSAGLMNDNWSALQQ
ncbi:hypothetical protein P3L10_013239 [Capsicum annuum]